MAASFIVFSTFCEGTVRFIRHKLIEKCGMLYGNYNSWVAPPTAATTLVWGSIEKVGTLHYMIGTSFCMQRSLYFSKSAATISCTACVWMLGYKVTKVSHIFFLFCKVRKLSFIFFCVSPFQACLGWVCECKLSAVYYFCR